MKPATVGRSEGEEGGAELLAAQANPVTKRNGGVDGFFSVSAFYSSHPSASTPLTFFVVLLQPDNYR